MRYKEPFTLFKKTLPSGLGVYYYTVWDDSGRRKQYSTGHRLKHEALLLTLKLYKAGQLIPQGPQTLRDFTENWFLYDQCPYIQGKLLRGYTYSRSFADQQRHNLTTQLWPVFGDIKLRSLTPGMIENWILKLKHQGYANATVNHHLALLKSILTEAHRLGYLVDNPGRAVKSLAENCAPKGILTETEAQALFAAKTWETVWSKDRLQYLINKTAIQTGMRLGEIQGLQKDCLFNTHLLVKRSWDRNYGIKGTKTNDSRSIPISMELYQELHHMALGQTQGEYVFSCSEGVQPIDHKAITKWFTRALEKIGIPDKERKERKISFHSYRWYLNTKLRSLGLPDALVRSMTGHSETSGMTEHYTNITAENLKTALEGVGFWE